MVPAHVTGKGRPTSPAERLSSKVSRSWLAKIAIGMSIEVPNHESMFILRKDSMGDMKLYDRFDMPDANCCLAHVFLTNEITCR